MESHPPYQAYGHALCHHKSLTFILKTLAFDYLDQIDLFKLSYLDSNFKHGLVELRSFLLHLLRDTNHPAIR